MKVLFNPPFLVVKASQLGCHGYEFKCYTHDKGRGIGAQAVKVH